VDEGVRDPRADTPRVTSDNSSVASFIVESLERAGVDVVFGLPGVHALGLFNAVEKSNLKYIGLRHEHAAAHAADGYGRATGKPGVVLLSTGPGALNALSGIGEAYVSSSPVLAITSAIPTDLAGAGKGFLHEIKDLAPAFAAVTRFSGRAGTVDDVPELLNSALAACFDTRPGTAMIEIPMDLIDAEIEHEPLGDPMTPRAVGGDETAELENAAWLLSLAARPLIWAGGGVIRSGASAELLRVAETLDAPVITTFMGKGAIPEDHPLAVGTMVRQPEAADLLRGADLMLAVGTRFSAMSTSSWKLEIPSQLIHIDADKEEIGRNYPVRLGIHADARAALE
jgi:thiamine pyrophosphate-dependent acetolactate synthase large subunit-like protein